MSVYQLVLLWEAVFGFSEFFFKTQRIFPFHDGQFTSVPAHSTLSIEQFLTKDRMTPVPHPPYSPDLGRSDFFLCFPNEKSPWKEMFCRCGRGETKNGRSTKSHQNRWLQKMFWAVEKMSWCVYCIEWGIFYRWLKFKHIRIDTQFFINKFWVLGAPSPIINGSILLPYLFPSWQLSRSEFVCLLILCTSYWNISSMKSRF